ncbi:MAG: hypothetical protein AAGI91_15290 [Bacteroidota bacterium]
MDRPETERPDATPRPTSGLPGPRPLGRDADAASDDARHRLGSARARFLDALGLAGHTVVVGLGLLVAFISGVFEWLVLRDLLGVGGLVAAALVVGLEGGKVGGVLYGREGSAIRVATAVGLFALSVLASALLISAGTDAPGAERLRDEARDRIQTAHAAEVQAVEDRFGPAVATFERRMAEEEASGYGRKYRESERQRDRLRAEWTAERRAADGRLADALRDLDENRTFRESPLAQQPHLSAFRALLAGLGLPIPYEAFPLAIALLVACVMEGVIFITFDGLRARAGALLDHEDRLAAIDADLRRRKRAQDADHEAARHDIEGHSRAIRDGLGAASGDGAASAGGDPFGPPPPPPATAR